MAAVFTDPEPLRFLPGLLKDRSSPLVPLVGLVAAALVVDGDLPSSYAKWRDKLRTKAEEDPIDTLLVTVLGGGLLFHWAEHGRNPRVNHLWDSVLYIATCLSVGYDDVFPKTPLGNSIAAAVQTFGPAMAAAALNPPLAIPPETPPAPDPVAAELLEVNRAILARLETIADALSQKQASSPAAADIGTPS